MTDSVSYIPLSAATDAIRRGLADMASRMNDGDASPSAFTLDTSGAVDVNALIAAARAEERERCAKALEAEASQWERNWVANVLIEQASAIRALRDE
jgi:hypothetical protein